MPLIILFDLPWAARVIAALLVPKSKYQRKRKYSNIQVICFQPCFVLLTFILAPACASVAELAKRWPTDLTVPG